MVPVETVLARGEDVAVGIGRLGVYPQGFECDVFASARLELDLDPFEHDPRSGDASSTDSLYFGVEFSDGRNVTNTYAAQGAESGRDPNALVMIEQDGGGGTGGWIQTYWVAPLPRSGAVKFVVAWPAVGVPDGRTDVDAPLFLAAAKRSQAIWDLPDAPEGFAERE
jgi:hypothetical protein